MRLFFWGISLSKYLQFKRFSAGRRDIPELQTKNSTTHHMMSCLLLLLIFPNDDDEVGLRNTAWLEGQRRSETKEGAKKNSIVPERRRPKAIDKER
jgi:hypothetical protein